MHLPQHIIYIRYSNKFSRSKIFTVIFRSNRENYPLKRFTPSKFVHHVTGSCKVFMKRIMALFRYFSSVPDKPAKLPDPLGLHYIGKHGSESCAWDQKADHTKRAAEHGVAATIRHYAKKLNKIGMGPPCLQSSKIISRMVCLHGTFYTPTGAHMLLETGLWRPIRWPFECLTEYGKLGQFLDLVTNNILWSMPA